MPVETPKRTGLVIGITSGAIALIATIVTIVLILALGSDPIVGTWEATVDGETMNFVLAKNNTGSIDSFGMTLPVTWERDDETLKVTMSFLGQSATENYDIKHLTEDTLIMTSNNNKDVIQFTKVD